MLFNLNLNKDKVSGSKIKIFVDYQKYSQFEFIEFLKILKQNNVNFEIIEESEDRFGYPKIVLDGINNFQYHNIPYNLQSESFEYMLEVQKNGIKNYEFSDYIKNNCDKKDVILFISNECPISQDLVKELLNISYFCKDINIHIVNPLIAEGYYEEYSIRMIPYLVLEDNGYIIKDSYEYLSREELINFILK